MLITAWREGRLGLPSRGLRSLVFRHNWRQKQWALCSTYYVPGTMLSSLEILNPHENVTINSPILQVHKLRHKEVSMRQPVELGAQP